MAMKLTVKAGEHDREQCPVSVPVDLGGVHADRLALTPEDGGKAIPCQLEASAGGQLLSWIVDELPARQQKVYVLQEGAPATGGVQLAQEAEDRVDVTIDGSPFTAFHYGEQWSRPFLHPIIGPFGNCITRSYPVIPDIPGEKQDHPHHKSFWVAWGDVNGTDNWSENNETGHAKVRVRVVHEMLSGPVLGRIATTNDWISEKGDNVLEEDRAVVFYATPAAVRAVDLTVTFRATRGPVRFGDTKEGGICSIRVASSMDASGEGTIVNSFGGTNEAETWGKRAHWCDYTGPVEGRTVGIAILDHPGNLRHPTYWHVRNYGLMTANPFGISHFLGDRTLDGSYRLEAGGVLEFRYRVLFHAGDSQSADVAARYHDFINPPTVEVTD